VSDKRQNNQLELAFAAGGRGESPETASEGTEPRPATRATESPAETKQLMEEVCQRANLTEALRQVQANKGSPGVDGMTVDELPEHLREHWPAIRAQLLSGTYRPQPV
jgi:RNA-directed DNA polymerase